MCDLAWMLQRTDWQKAVYETDRAQMSQQADMTYRRPPRVMLRATLHQALAEHGKRKLRARAANADDNQRALANLKEIAQLAEAPSVGVGAN